MGLRAQIVLALAVLFALSSGLVGLVSVRLTQRTRDLSEQRSVRRLAHLLYESQSQGMDEAEFGLLLEHARQTFSLRALRFEAGGRRPLGRGQPPRQPGTTIPLPAGSKLTFWRAPPAASRSGSLTGLLLFYVVATGLAMLLLTYFALTHLIVAPLDQLTRAAERLDSRRAFAQIPGRSAVEVRRLAHALNDMAAKLRAERAELEQKLQELKQAGSDLRATQEILVRSEKLASVGRLAAGVAHEIGNPLAAILGFVELLQSGGLQEARQREFLGRIRSETERIHTIIRDLLDFSRRSQVEQLEVSSDAVAAAQDAINLIKPQKGMREIALELEVAPDVFRVAGPQHRLTQVVLNLLLNAVDALEGKGTIQVGITPNEDHSMLILSVTDNGPGIAEDMLDKLFEPFTTSKPVGKGTGLGMAVSHTLVTSVGGSISASNPPEGGARIEVLLPRDRASRTAAPGRLSIAAKPG